MKRNNILFKYYYHNSVKKKSLLIWVIMIVPFIVFSQKQASIQHLPEQKYLPSLNNNEPEVNAEFAYAVREYETLLKKYPDKKELYYNLGNLNYFSGDAESALKNYQNSLIDSDLHTKAHTLYNMGNALYQMGDIQKSVEHFKEALTLAPDDGDIRHNYELSKRMLEQQPPQENKDPYQNEDERGEEQNQDKQLQQSQEGDEQEEKSGRGDKKEDKGNVEKQEQSENVEEHDEKEQNQLQDQNVDENNMDEQNQQLSEPQDQEQKKKQLGREEAEAILNALKADESNLKPIKYTAVQQIKLEKDW